MNNIKTNPKIIKDNTINKNIAMNSITMGLDNIKLQEKKLGDFPPKKVLTKNCKHCKKIIYNDKTKTKRDYWRCSTCYECKAANTKILNEIKKNHPKPKMICCPVCRDTITVSRQIQCDHDHETKEFRGWICERCNRALGNTDDNPLKAIGMLEYLMNTTGKLRKHKKKKPILKKLDDLRKLL